MITIKPAKAESRARDVRRFRAVLTVGDRTIHLTTKEVLDLAADAIRTAFVLTKRETANRRRTLIRALKGGGR